MARDKAYYEAENRIAEARQYINNALFLEDLGLTEIPESLRLLSDLQELHLANNKLSALPDWISQFTKLRLFDVSSNQLTDLPSSIGDLIQLQILSVNENKLTELPKTLGKLIHLKSLTAAYNQLQELPIWLDKLVQLQILDVSHNQILLLPECINQLILLQSLDISENQLSLLPESLVRLVQLQALDVSNNRLSILPKSIGNCTQLHSLSLSKNLLTTLPESIGELIKLPSLNLAGNQLTILPDSLSNLKELKFLDISGNSISTLPKTFEVFSELFVVYNQLSIEPKNLKRLTLFLDGHQVANLPKLLSQHKKLHSLRILIDTSVVLPDTLGQLTQLRFLDLSENYLTTLPKQIGQLIQLQSLNLLENKLITLPEEIGQLTHLQSLNLYKNNLTALPEEIGQLVHLQELTLSCNQLRELPESFVKLTNLESLNLIENQLTTLPASMGQLTQLKRINLHGNPLNPEFAKAYEQGLDAVKSYLRAKIDSTILNEAKLILVGEGEVGKTCLTDALLDNPWQEHDTTHGIQIKPIKLPVSDSQTAITLNAWDFGGQRVYRPTHQLFFSAPAVYLVVWKPREGVKQNFVQEWIQLIKRREPSAKILVVATHCGFQQRQPDIDRQELWDLFGKETVVDFFFVESKPDEHGNRKGIDELKRAIAQVAASLPEVGRSVPKSFADVRQALQDKGAPYLPLREVLDICLTHNMDDEIARLFITISHRLGHLTHYENDPTLRDIVILRPDWLATAMSYVLDDEATRAAHGLVKFSRLAQLWDDKNRAADSRYPATLHPIFLRLMERFDLSYRVADLTSRGRGDPMGRPYEDTTSLIGQLVPDIRPQNISDAWKSSPASGDIQQTQICHLVDASNGQSASAEGLFYQLIVRLHKYSLGRADYNASVHWQRGLVLEDEYKSRAFLEHVGNDVRITVRSPYPEGLLGMLTREVKFLVESFWEGLRCDVMVPCIDPCGKNNAGIGLFEVEKLMTFKRQGMTMFPCMVSGCNQAQDIDALLRNAPAATQSISLVDLQSEFTTIKDKLDEVNVTSRRILSQVDKTYTDLLQVLTDEAKEGPRLFSLFPLDGNKFNPQTWVREKFRLVLWCEHSRLPIPVHNNWDMTKGVYDFELDREWFKRAVPFLKFMTGTLSLVLPIMSSTLKVVDDTAFKKLENDISLGKDMIDFFSGEGTALKEVMGPADTTNLENGVGVRAENATLRELHALLKAKDPGFGGLVRVMNKRQEFLWVHEKFAGEY